LQDFNRATQSSNFFNERNQNIRPYQNLIRNSGDTNLVLHAMRNERNFAEDDFESDEEVKEARFDFDMQRELEDLFLPEMHF